MDMKEKLVELLKKARVTFYTARFNSDYYDYVAGRLIADGVTVQEGKPLEAFLHPIDAYKGLKAKYLVFKADTGEKVDNCFILCPDKDTVAVEAIRAYASATDNETLAEDIYNWVGKGKPVQKWSSVKDRLPEKYGRYLALTPGYLKGFEQYNAWLIYYHPESGFYDTDPQWGDIPMDDITHWMPLPQPPKGE